jgi:hypothetical protein
LTNIEASLAQASPPAPIYARVRLAERIFFAASCAATGYLVAYVSRKTLVDGPTSATAGHVFWTALPFLILAGLLVAGIAVPPGVRAWVAGAVLTPVGVAIEQAVDVGESLPVGVLALAIPILVAVVVVRIVEKQQRVPLR